MIVFYRDIIDACIFKHAACKKAMNKFVGDLIDADCKTHNELIRYFPKADYVGDNRYVFDIKGNHFRVVCVVVFVADTVMIRFAGTHNEYDKIDAKTV